MAIFGYILFNLIMFLILTSIWGIGAGIGFVVVFNVTLYILSRIEED